MDRKEIDRIVDNLAQCVYPSVHKTVIEPPNNRVELYFSLEDVKKAIRLGLEKGLGINKKE